MRNFVDRQIDNGKIDDVFFSDALSTFILSFFVCFFSIFGGLVLAVYLIRILIERNML